METAIIRLGKRNAVYIPKRFVDELEIRPGDRIQLSLEDRILRMEILEDPLRLAIKGRRFASITPEEVESISMEEQERDAGDST